jgi:glycosyltransferase involved in cell wall biosynthesis
LAGAQLAQARRQRLLTGRAVKQAISCIIPVYNERERVRAVVEVIAAHPSIDEIIVVDDGSTDGTSEVIADIDGVRLISHARNSGKSMAIVSGIEAANGSLIMMIDGDLVDLTAEHLSQLIEPVASGRADFSISLRGKTLRVWRLIGIDYLSGERVFPKSLLEGRIDAIKALPRFGFEIFMNGICIDRKLSVAIVDLPGLESPLKFVKHGFWEGVVGDAKMLRDLLRMRSVFGLARQIVALRRLRV